MKKSIIFLISWLCWINAWAHNPNIATYTLRDTGAGWMIEINFAQAGLLTALESDLSKSDFGNLSNENLKSHLIEKVQHNFNLEVDGIEVPLRDGGILMGSHQTNFKFILPEIPANPEQMKVSIPMCSGAYNHTNIFRIYRGGERIYKFFLSEDNEFQVKLALSDEMVETVDVPELSASAGFRYGYSSMMLILIVFLFGIWRFRKKLKIS